MEKPTQQFVKASQKKKKERKKSTLCEYSKILRQFAKRRKSYEPFVIRRHFTLNVPKFSFQFGKNPSLI